MDRTRPAFRSATAIVAVAFTFSVAACSGSEPRADSDSAATAGATSTVEQGAADATVVAALDFRAPLVGGGEFDGSAYTERPVVFWFWAPT